MAYTQENIQFWEYLVRHNLINFLNFIIDMGTLSGAGRLFHNIDRLNLINRFPMLIAQKTHANCYSSAYYDYEQIY